MAPSADALVPCPPERLKTYYYPTTQQSFSRAGVLLFTKTISS
jgi:hypothetical protein